MTWPSRSHWYVVLTGAWFHVGAIAVTVAPTPVPDGAEIWTALVADSVWITTGCDVATPSL